MKHMSKAVSVFLALALLLALLPMAALAESEPAFVSFTLAGQDGDDTRTGTVTRSDGTTTEILFQKWDSADSLPGAGSYYLSSDVKVDSGGDNGGVVSFYSPAWAVKADVNLCLNGHGIDYTGSSSNLLGAVIMVSNATLRVYDCGTTAHNYSIQNNGRAVLDENGTKSFTGGYITSNTSDLRGVWIYDGVFELYGGSILGIESNYGAGVYVGTYSNSNAGTFNMLGGCIFGNYARNYGGGVYISSQGAFKMTGGSIERNTAEEKGGGVYVDNGSFVMTGGSIEGNTAGIKGGGVAAYECTAFKLSGKPEITGNTNGDILLLKYEGDPFTPITIDGALDNSKPIGVIIGEDHTTPPEDYGMEGEFTEDFSDVEATTPVEDCFTSDDDRYTVISVPGTRENQTRLKLVETDKVCKVTFDGNGATGGAMQPNPQKILKDTATALKANAFTRQGYYFVEWDTEPAGGGTAYADKASVTLTADTTLYARWALCSYEITWLNDDGTVLKQEQVDYCVMPDCEAPVKAADARYTYAFAGWTPEVVPATADATYTATFTATEKPQPAPAPVDYDPAPAAPKETRFDEVDVTKGGSLENFKQVGTYTPGMFADAGEDDWYMENLKAAVELGILEGLGDGTFGVGQPLKLSETLAIACRLHNLYYGGSGKFDQTKDADWYAVYADYAAKYGIAAKGQYDLTKPATRAQFAAILAAALPDAALAPINAVTVLPDMAPDDPRLPAVLKLYNAGILTGVDAAGSFAPDAVIPREQVAAMATRVADPALRRAFAL